MKEQRSILEILETNGQLPPKPRGTEYAIKFVNPDWTTWGGYRWPFPGKWTPPLEDGEWNPTACEAGGVHVATTVAGAQSGGARASHCVVVAYRRSDMGEWEGGDVLSGKLKVRRAKSLAVVDLVGVLRRDGARADLNGANLTRANLTRAHLAGADLSGANLDGANLYEAHLSRAYLAGANLSGANLTGADLSGAYLTRATLTGADLYGANLTRAYLNEAYLSRAYLSRADLTRAHLNGHDRDNLKQRGAIL